MAGLLIISAVGGAIATGIGGIEHINRLFTQRCVQLFQRGRLGTSQKELGVHIADDGVSVIFIDGFQLASGLQNQAGRNLTASDSRHQLFQVWYLTDIGALVDQAADMNREPAAIYVICLFTQQIEQLRVCHGNQEVECAVRI